MPFFWTFSLWQEMVFVAAIVLALYLVVDVTCWRREDPSVRAPAPGRRDPLRVAGAHNLLLLAGVLAGVIASGFWPGPEVDLLGVHQRVGNLVRDAVLLVMLGLSWRTTSAAVRDANEYSWGPIKEVAILFAGIFVTMIPALAMLRVGEQGAMAGIVGAVREARALLLGERSAVVLPRQRADLPRLPLDGARAPVPRRARTAGGGTADRGASGLPERRFPPDRSSWVPTPTSATHPTSW